ncbi:MAG: Gfo/Idh/MocA family oxidoreductase [Planctomycetes bacterium]|nr:Gfo/Idh/MocA family oxidoreductase [Planctomycetota bacterium]
MALRVAMVGCGRMAGFIDREVEHYPAIKLPYSHGAAFDACPETEMVACCARRQESVDRFRKKWNVPKGYLDWREMIEKENPDIVSITTHADLHAPITLFSAEHGVRGIYCEKAIALSLEEADRAVAACRKAGAHLTIGHLRRWHNVHIAAVDFIRSGAIGRLVALHTIHTNELFHTGTHSFDLLNMYAGAAPDFVQACVTSSGFDRSAAEYTEDVAAVGFIRYRNGVTAFVHGSTAKPPLFDQEIVCEDGVIRVMNNGVDWELWTLQEWERPEFKDGPVWEEVPEIATLQRADLPFPTEVESMTLAAVDDLVHAIQTGEDTRSTGEDGRMALELGMAFVESERQGGARVSIPMENRNIVVHSR